MITLEIDKAQIKRLKESLGDKAKRLPREVEIAINGTGKAIIGEIKHNKRGVRSELAVKAGEIKRATDFKRAQRPRLTATVTLAKQKRIWLQGFGAKQVRTGGGGVSYLIDPKKGRQRVQNAFLINPAGHVYKRQGRARGPLVKLHGASPWGAYRKRNLHPRIVRFGKSRLRKEIDKRIHTALFKRGAK